MKINKSNTNSLNKICVIGAYFGKLPNYFPLWLKSCEYNRKIDFIIVTDVDLNIEIPNIYVISSSLSEIKKRAEQVLGFKCSLERPYKLCDYKPIYGDIFKEYISIYDYWGHCDFDVIFGDIFHYFEKFELYNYDKINMLGHLAFYRNTAEVNNRYKLVGSRVDYKTVFTSNKSYIFDEIPGIDAIYLKNNFPIFTKRIFVDVASLYKRYRMIDSYEYDVKAQNYKYQIFYWEKGKIFHAYFVKNQLYKKEYQYIHFKKRPDFKVDFDYIDINAFYITPNGFIPRTEEVTKAIIKQYNKCYSAVYEWVEKHFYILKSRIKNKFNK